MKYLPALFFILLLMIFISCDSDGKKINGDILVSINPEQPPYGLIYRMNEEGELTNISPFKDYGSGDARWSPDGKHIVFTTAKRSTTLGSSMYIMDSDGSNPKPIKELHFGSEIIPLFGSNPAWSPDGKKIAYSQCACEAGGNSEIYIVDLQTKQEIRLTDDNFPDGMPHWFPDGSKILFESGERDSVHGGELYSINTDGSNLTQITFNRGRDAAWGNNDSILAYFSQNDTSIHIRNIKTMMDIDKIPIHLTNEILNPTMTFSPDNTNILFLTINIGDYPFQRLYKLNLTNHEITRLLETYNYVFYVDWMKR